MSYNTKKFLDTEGVKHLVKLLDNYPNNQILGTVIDSIQEELDKKANVSDIPEVPVQDIQINGTSILNNNVANIPVADANNLGAVKIRIGYSGLRIDDNGFLTTYPAMPIDIKTGIHQQRQPAVNRQHESTFYGLAKAAGADMKDIADTTVGAYPDAQKEAIQSMLGITQMLAPENPNLVASQAYKIGDVFAANGHLYKATIAIAQNAAIIVEGAGANCIETKLIDEIQLINKTLTVTVLTQDNVIVTGQTVTVRADNADGEVYATAAYEGQPVSFSLPTGFQYYVSVTDTLNRHFNPTTVRGVIKDTNVSVTLQYSDLSTIKTARDIKAALDAGIDLTDLVGEQITCTKGSDTLSWDIVDYDETNKNVTLLLHDIFGTANMVFEPTQALMWCENGLAAGSYTFTWKDTQCYFTLTTAIPAGGQLRATDSQFATFASQDATVALERGTVGTDKIAGAIDLGHEGQGLLNHRDRVSQGSNNFAESALFWWLNSDAAANTLRVPVTKFSRPHSYTQPGFMNSLDADFVNCLDEVDWLCSTNNVYECPESLGGYTKGTRQTYTVKAKFGLASEMEIFGSYSGNADGSKVFDLYNDESTTDRIKYRGTSAQNWWFRSPLWSSVYSERYTRSSGSAGHYNAVYSCGAVPVCRISRTVKE